ncbi:MAG: hypothetical protein AAGA66_02380 [Bacteroidota bacterium]
MKAALSNSVRKLVQKEGKTLTRLRLGVASTPGKTASDGDISIKVAGKHTPS